MAKDTPYNIEDYDLVRSKRRTVGLQITPEGRLVVRAPARASQKRIEDLLEKYKKWISEKMHEAVFQRKIRPKKKYIDGEEFLYLGEKYKLSLKHIKTSKNNVKFDDEFHVAAHTPKEVKITDSATLHLRLPASRQDEEAVKSSLEKWYLSESKKFIVKRVRLIAHANNIKVMNVKISKAERRWGSCSSKGNVNISWKLIMSPLQVLDYVIVHELAHTRQMNHSAKFWNEVKKMMPDYEVWYKWLKDNGASLEI